MNPKRFILPAAALALAGCASTPLPPGAAAVRLDRTPSKSVAVYQPKLVVKDGGLLLDGWVYRQYRAETTMQTHIDVVFLDASGRELRSEVTYFSPREIRRRGGHRMAPRGHYTRAIPELPVGTATIHVRAHDGEHR